MRMGAVYWRIESEQCIVIPLFGIVAYTHHMARRVFCLVVGLFGEGIISIKVRVGCSKLKNGAHFQLGLLTHCVI